MLNLVLVQVIFGTYNDLIETAVTGTQRLIKYLHIVESYLLSKPNSTIAKEKFFIFFISKTLFRLHAVQICDIK